MKNITKNMDNKVKERLDEVSRGVADVYFLIIYYSIILSIRYRINFVNT